MPENTKPTSWEDFNPGYTGSSTPEITRKTSNFTPEMVKNFSEYGVDTKASAGSPMEQLGQNQSNGEKIWHGFERLVGTTVTKAGEGVGYVGGFLDYGIHGFDDISRMTDNGVSASFLATENNIKQGAPVFTPPSVSNGNLLGKASSLSWWMDQGVDGFAFAASSLLPGMAFTKIGLGMKVASLISEESSLLKLAGGATKFAEGMNTTSIAAYNTVSEAAMEAKGVQDQIRKDYGEQVSKGTISQDDVEKKAAKAAQSTFWWNVVALIGPEMIQSKLLFGGPNEASIIKSIIDPATGKVLSNAGQLTKGQLAKEMLKQAGLGFVREGLWEENVQTSIQNYETAIGEGKQDKGAITSILGGMYDNLFTNAGQESIFLGGIMGIGMGAVGGGIQESKKSAIIASAAQFMNNHIGTYMDNLNSNVKGAFEKNEDGSIKLDHDGTPIIDVEKAGQVLAAHAQKSQIGAIKTLALLTGNKDLYEHIKNNEFTAFALPFLHYDGGLEVLNRQIDALADKELEQAKGVEEITIGKQVSVEQLKSQYKEKAKQLNETFHSIKQRTGIWDFTESSKESKEYDSWLQQYQQMVALQSSQADFFRNKAKTAALEFTELSNKIVTDSETGFVTEDEKTRLKLAEDKIKNYKELFEKSNVEYKRLSNKEEAKKEYGIFKQQIIKTKEVKKDLTDKEDKQTKEVVDVHTKNVDRLNEIDQEIADLDEQMQKADTQATDEEMSVMSKKMRDLEDQKAAIVKSQDDANAIKNRADNVSHINKHSLKEGEPAIYNGEEGTIVSNTLDANTGLATVTNGNQVFSNVNIKEITKINQSTGDDNGPVSKTMSEGSNTDLKSPKLAELDDTLMHSTKPLNKGRVNVVMSKQFGSKQRETKNKRQIFTWLRDKLGYALKEPNINKFDYGFINSPTSLLPGDSIEYRIVTPDAEQAKVFTDTAIGIYQKDKGEDKLVGFVAEPTSIEKLNKINDSDFRKKLEAERVKLIEHRQQIIDKLNKGEKVESKVSEKGTGNYVARIVENGEDVQDGKKGTLFGSTFVENGSGVFYNGNGDVISLFNDDLQIREQDKVGGNAIFAVVRNGSLVLPDIRESNKLDRTAHREITSKIKSDLADLIKQGNHYAAIEGQTFMLVKSANGKWAPIPVYSTYHTIETADKVIEVLKRNSAETVPTTIVSALNKLVYATADTTGKIQVFRGTGLDNQQHTFIFVNGEKFALDDLKDNTTIANNLRNALLSNRQNIYAADLNTEEGQTRIRENRSITTNVAQIDGDYFVQPYVEYATKETETKVTEPTNNEEFNKPVSKEEYAAREEKLKADFDALFNNAEKVTVKSNPSEQEAEKTNIEKRRQETLNNIKEDFNGDDGITYELKFTTLEQSIDNIKSGIDSNFYNKQDLVDKINTKYDLELAALDKKSTKKVNLFADYNNDGDILEEKLRKDDITLKGEGLQKSRELSYQEFANELSDRLGVNIVFSNEESINNGQWDPTNNTITIFPKNILRTGRNIKEVIFHEFAHPFVRKLFKENKVLFNKHKEILEKTKFFERLKTSTEYKNFSNDFLIEEAFVRSLEKRYSLLETDKDLKNIKNDFIKWITGNNNIDLKTINENSSIEDIYNIFKNHSNLKIKSTNENESEVKAWFKKNLPQFPPHMVQEIIDINGNMVSAWGIFRNNIIEVVKGAPRGTAKHEAFHAVFNNMLTDKEKGELLQEAAQRWGMPTLDMLDELQKLYKTKLSGESLLRLFYEEKMAVAHEEYSDTFEPDTKWQKMKNFFKRIAKLFGFFKKFEASKIDRIFKKLNTGKFAKKNVRIQNTSREIANADGLMKPIIGLEGKPVFSAAYKQQRVNSLTNKFQVEFMRLVASKVDPKSISANQIYATILNDYREIRKDMVNNYSKWPAQTKVNMLIFTDPNNYSQFVSESKKQLATMKINVGKNVEFNEQDFSVDDDDDLSGVDIPKITGNVTKGLGEEHVYQSGLSHASTRLKMFLMGIPVKYSDGNTKRDDFMDTIYHDFNEVYSYIEKNLIGLNTLEDQLDELGDLSLNRPELKEVINRLTIQQPDQSDDEFQRLKDDFTSNFSKQHLGYTLVMSSVNNDGGVEYTILDANRQTVGREVFNDWKNNLLKADKITISEIKEGIVTFNGTKKAKQALIEWNNIVGVKEQFTFENVNKVLLKIGVEYSPDTLREIIKENSVDFIREASYMFHYFAAEPSESEGWKAEAMKNQMRLVGYETKYKLTRYTTSFQNGQKKNIWSIQLPSFSSKLIAKLTNRNTSVVNAELADLRRNKANIYSNLINKLSEPEFRNTFKVTYLDSLKNKKGNGLGVNFINMNPKDYLGMSIALYHNKESNQNRIATGDIHKYIGITPSDKSMVSIVDSNSYGVTINKSGKLNEESEIIEKYYNTVKMEIQRISDQLKVKEKVLSGELKKEDLKLHYHYSDKEFNDSFKQDDPSKFKFDGFAYKFNEFKSLNEGTKETPSVLETLTKSLETGVDYSEIESVFKDRIITAIVAELNVELENSLKEAHDKDIISIDKETGEITNLALDWVSKSMQQPLEITHRIKQTLGDFALNQRLHYIEISNLMNGDIAQYKTNDLAKRAYQNQAMSVSIVAIKGQTVKTMLVKDVKIESDYLNRGNEKYNSWMETLQSAPLNYSQAKAEKMLAKYKNTNVTDATVIVHPTLYKKMMKRVWDDKLQAAYDIAEGITKNPTEEQLKVAQRVLSEVKPFSYGRRFDEKLGIHIYEQIKTLLVPAFKSYVKGNELLSKQREMMDKSGVEMLAFESSFKASIGYRFDINELTQDHYDNNSFDFDLDNLGIQVDNPSHFYEEQNNSLRQVKMIMAGAIDFNKSYNGVSGRVLFDRIDSTEATNVIEDLKILMDKINRMDDSFKQDLAATLTKRNATENMEAMLEIRDGQFVWPLNSGTHEITAQNILSAMFTSGVIKQSFAGGALANTTSLGTGSAQFMKQADIDANPFIKELQSKLQHIRENKVTGQIEHAETLVPAHMKAFYDQDGKLKDINDIDDNLKEMFLYRIPTEFLHSMLPARIVGFLPEHMGNMILLPYDITTQMGLDFDFDKLYFIRPEYDMIDGKAMKAEYNESKPIGENSRKARNNRIFDSYMGFVRSKENFDKVIAPSDFHELQKWKSEIEKESRKSDNKSFFSGITQRELKDRNHISLALKAMTSLEVTGHSYATKMGISSRNKLKFNGIEGLNLSSIENFTGQNIAQLLYKVQAAVMDDAKAPIMATIGINKNTIGVFSAIIRTGYSFETAINMITQPAIVELAAKMEMNNGKLRKQRESRTTIQSLENSYINRYFAIKEMLPEINQKQLEENEKYFISTDKGTKPTYNLNDESDGKTRDQRSWGMKEWRVYAKDVDVNDFSKENVLAYPELADYYMFQSKVLFNYGRYTQISEGLSKLNKLFALNTRIGPNIENMNDQVYNLEEITSDNFIIQNVSGYKNMKALDTYVKVLYSAYKYFKTEFPYATKAIEDIKTQIVESQMDYNNTVINKLSVESRRKINGFVSSYLDRATLPEFQKLFDLEEQKRIMTGLGTQISEIMSLKNEQYAELRKNLFLEAIRVIWNEKGKNGVKFIELRGNKLEPNVKNNISEAFYSLYNNKNTKELALDLIKYSVLSSGLYSGIHSFHDLIPPQILVDLGYPKNRKQNNFYLNTQPLRALSYADRELLKDLIIRNFTGDFTKVANSSIFRINREDNTITTNYMRTLEGNQVYQLVTRKPTTKEPTTKFTEYVRVFMNDVNKVELYKRIKADDNNVTYQRVSFLGQKARFLEMVNPDGESLIPANNYDYSVESAENADANYDPAQHEIQDSEDAPEENDPSMIDNSTEELPMEENDSEMVIANEFDQNQEMFNQNNDRVNTSKSNPFVNLEINSEDEQELQKEDDVTKICD